MEHIVFLDGSSLEATIRRPAFPHQWEEYAITSPEEIVTRLQEATIAITNKVPLRAETLAQLPRLKLIAEAATGVNNIDVDWCREHGIAVANMRNYAIHAVPEHVFMMILALRRNLLAYRADLQKGLWQQSDRFCLFNHPIRDIHGSTLGIIGHGALGQAVAEMAKAFGMKVLFAEHQGVIEVRPGFAPFEQVLAESDIVTLHVPLTDATRNLIGADEIRRMKPSSLLINAARGGVVDENALAEALRVGRIAGAGCDVLSVEPPCAGNPLLDLDLPNLIVTPHIAWASCEAMQILADQLVGNIEAFVAGTPRNLVT
ncbi:glycerate dehydrogenase [Sulfuricella sp. T08]|uniref:D-2-hydroxyacid dehydrogenase n=1 Tax=Sulfuricella sp. T08 TaxID=1632857 RepID=UPI0006179CF8|nr:D-2-hydroxyacid dehydrogenase [Sulfuricella sp. T08]GAO37199.1 glycerate dehydrogenase [Sulfuricella sp. T08]